MQSSNPKQRKLIILIVILVLAAIILGIGAMLVTRSGTGPTLNKLGAVQREIARINDLADKFGPDLALDQARSNIAALTASDITLVEPERARASGDKNLPKNIVAEATVADAEKSLESAARRNSLTAAYVELISDQLGKERSLLNTARSQAKSERLKQILEMVENHVASMTKQVDGLLPQ